jgi:ligand-binding sensor domain-containing protein
LRELFLVIKNEKSMKKYLQIKLLLLLFVSITSCNGQKETDPPKENPSQTENKVLNHDPYFVESTTITTSYGPSSITRNIMQDRKGDFWFATWEGIIRYDGNSFTNFTNKENLRRFHVFSVLEDKSGNLWFGTIGAGLYRYDGKSFTNFTTKEGLAHDRLGCFYEDKTGKIWIGTVGGISVYDGNSFRNFTTNEGLTNNDVNSIIEDKTGKIWIGTRGEACFYDGTTFTRFTNKEDQPFTNVRSIVEDKKGNIWLGGNDGLWRYDGSSFTNFTTDFVGYIYEDKKGNIWTNSADNGNANNWVLSRYDENSLQYEMATATQIRTEKNMFFGILEDKEGGIWFGTLNGVCRYDGKSFNYFKNKEAKE